jgi:protein O-mannosyl-transferase
MRSIPKCNNPPAAQSAAADDPPMAKGRKISICQSPPPALPGAADDGGQRGRVAGICLALAAITFAVFGQTLHSQFVNYDDDKYVYENSMVLKGLTWKGVFWALRYEEIGHWHPLTWLSHMADCQAFGLWAGGHHLTNVVLHAVAATLLFLALRAMTGAVWRSAFVAAVFAIHPLRVESVAWIAERKDVLSGVFFMLTLWAYARYARQPSRWRYAAVAVFYGLGLLSKNTLVTLPLVLLLLDWWPLRRTGARKLAGLVVEKVPLLLLSAGSCVATLLSPEKVTGIERLPFLERLSNAVVSYGIYLRQTVFPAGLAIPYPFPENGLPFWEIALASTVLTATSISVLAWRKRHPYLLVGWLWYLGVLAPTIGLVQISYYSHADRYTYLAGIGLALAGTWAVADWSLRWKHRQAILGGLMVAVIGTLLVCAWTQTGYWKNNETLWSHALACTTGNYIADNNLGLTFFDEGKVDDAIAQYLESVRIRPGYPLARNNLGLAFDQKGRVSEAIAQYEKALESTPAYGEAQNNLGLDLLACGRTDEAIPHFQRAIQLKPASAEPVINLGDAYFRQQKLEEAIALYQKGAEIGTDEAIAYNGWGNALLQEGKVDEAISRYQEALQYESTNGLVHNNLGLALMRRGQMEEAIPHFQRAIQLRPDYVDPCLHLGELFLQAGKMNDAVRYLQMASRLKSDDAKTQLELGNALAQMGHAREAIVHYQQALQIEPANLSVMNNLAWFLATGTDASLRNGEKALQLARQANEMTGRNNPMVLRTLAAACAEAGRYSEAVEAAQRAMTLAQSNPGLVKVIQPELKLYQAGKPAHQ